jgi:hypothetical protein
MKKSELDTIIKEEAIKMLKAITQKAQAKPVETLTFVNKGGEAITASNVKAVERSGRLQEAVKAAMSDAPVKPLQEAIKAAMGMPPAVIKPTIEDVRKAGGNTVLAAIRAARAARTNS